MSHEHSREFLRMVRAEFLKVGAAAVPAYEMGQLELFSDEVEEYLRREVERMLFRPELPNGGAPERKIIERLKEMAQVEYWEGSEAGVNWGDGSGGEQKKSRKQLSWLAARASEAINQWVAVLPVCGCNGVGCPQCWDKAGRYYFKHPVTPKSDKLRFGWFTELRAVASVVKDWPAKWFADLMLEGPPEAVSDFAVQALCGVRRWDGSVLRLIRLSNVVGEKSRVLVLEAENFGAPEKFRTWCLAQGTFTSRLNQTHLQMVHEDTNRQIAWRVMEEVDACGWHPIKRLLPDGRETAESETPGILNGAWFYDECAYYNGQVLKPDEDGIYWINEQGYYMQERGRESEYALGRPRMQPDTKLAELKLDAREWKIPAKGKEEGALLRGYFTEVCRRFYDTLGGHEAYVALGAVWAYAAAPEIFDAHGLFPGLFVHGQMGSGKTKFTEWLAHLQGFRISAGVSIIKSSTVGILQEAQNYSNLMLWLDEFRNDPRSVDEHKIGLLRDAFNRLSPVKWTPEGVQRKIRTAFVVSGESTASDTATRSRYPHVQVSAAKRIENHLNWMTDQKKNTFIFWRVIMERRAEFVQHVMQGLRVWMGMKEIADVDEREKIVHGVSWAAWTAMANLVGYDNPDDAAGFDAFAVRHMRAAATDVVSETNVNVFWSDLITAYEAGAIPNSCFRLEQTASEYPPGHRWVSYRLWLEPNATIAALQAWLVKQHGAVTLRRRDLLHQCSRNEWWLEPMARRFGERGSLATMKGWGVDVDKHPLGRQPITEDELRASALTNDQKTLADIGLIFRDGDPRKGPLFTIIDGIEHEERKAEQARE